MKQYENDTLRCLFIKSIESHQPAFPGTSAGGYCMVKTIQNHYVVKIKPENPVQSGYKILYLGPEPSAKK